MKDFMEWFKDLNDVVVVITLGIGISTALAVIFAVTHMFVTGVLPLWFLVFIPILWFSGLILVYKKRGMN